MLTYEEKKLLAEKGLTVVQPEKKTMGMKQMTTAHAMYGWKARKGRTERGTPCLFKALLKRILEMALPRVEEERSASIPFLQTTEKNNSHSHPADLRTQSGDVGKPVEDCLGAGRYVQESKEREERGECKGIDGNTVLQDLGEDARSLALL